MSRIAFCCVWLVLPACFAQTTTLRPDAVPAEDPEMRAEAVRLMERADMLTTPVWPANEEFVDFRVLQPAPGETSEGSMKIGVKTPRTSAGNSLMALTSSLKFRMAASSPRFVRRAPSRRH